MVRIDRSQVLNSAKWSSGGNNHKTVLVFHETANKSRGAGAYAHHRLQYNGNPRQASWHYQVDDTVAVQTYNENLRLWHAGSVAIPFTISVEICINADSNYNQAMKNAVELGIDICKRNNITINNVVTHYFYTGKNCPTQLLSGKYGWTFTKFIQEIEKGLTGKKTTTVKPTKAPKKTSKSIDTLAKEVINGAYGNGAERMKALGTNYQAVQERVNQIVTGSSGKVVSKKPTIDQLVKEVLAGVHGNGAERKRKLGNNYNAVQSRINKMYS